jgi:tetratricopeptide (TPR) repeat protein
VEAVPEDTDPETRIDMLEEMAMDYPEDPLLYYQLGNLYYDQIMPTEARENYERALNLDPGLNKARVNLAMLLAESDEVDSAKVLLEEAIRLDPDDSRAYNNLGMVYYTELEVNTAVRYFNKALEVDPENAEAHYNLGLAFAESGILVEAINEWRRVLELVEEGETADRARMSLERVQSHLSK